MRRNYASQFAMQSTEFLPEPEDTPAVGLNYPASGQDLNRQLETDLAHSNLAEKLTGKVALITGADAGIGRAVAIAYAKEGANIAIVI